MPSPGRRTRTARLRPHPPSDVGSTPCDREVAPGCRSWMSRSSPPGLLPRRAHPGARTGERGQRAGSEAHPRADDVGATVATHLRHRHQTLPTLRRSIARARRDHGAWGGRRGARGALGRALRLSAQAPLARRSSSTRPVSPRPGQAPREAPSAARCRRTGTDTWARGQFGALFVLSAFCASAFRRQLRSFRALRAAQSLTNFEGFVHGWAHRACALIT